MGFISKLFGFIKPTEEKAEVPYKVEAPAVSPVADQASQAMVESVAPAKKKPAAKKAAGEKKPRAPRKPKEPKAE